MAKSVKSQVEGYMKEVIEQIVAEECGENYKELVRKRVREYIETSKCLSWNIQHDIDREIDKIAPEVLKTIDIKTIVENSTKFAVENIQEAFTKSLTDNLTYRMLSGMGLCR